MPAITVAPPPRPRGQPSPPPAIRRASPPPVPAPATRSVVPSPGQGGRSRSIQDLVAQVNHIGDPRTRSFVQEVVHALLQLHGVGLARIFEVIEETGNSAVNQQLFDDSVVRSVLLLHDLHPRSLAERLQQVLDKLLPSIRSAGANLELAWLRDGVARFRATGTGQGTGSSLPAIEPALRAAIDEFCPDLVRFELESARAAPTAPTGKDGQSPARPATR